MRREESDITKAIEGLREEGFTVPTKRIVCPSCDGRGHYVNPAIDGNGLTADDLDEAGEDFFEDYRAGVYDVTCVECHGANVIEDLDRTNATPEVVAGFEAWLDDAADLRACYAAEARMGA